MKALIKHRQNRNCRIRDAPRRTRLDILSTGGMARAEGRRTCCHGSFGNHRIPGMLRRTGKDPSSDDPRRTCSTSETKTRNIRSRRRSWASTTSIWLLSTCIPSRRRLNPARSSPPALKISISADRQCCARRRRTSSLSRSSRILRGSPARSRRTCDCGTTYETRYELALKVFELTAHYDAMIADYLKQHAVYTSLARYLYAHLRKSSGYALRRKIRTQEAAFYKLPGKTAGYAYR